MIKDECHCSLSSNGGLNAFSHNLTGVLAALCPEKV